MHLALHYDIQSKKWMMNRNLMLLLIESRVICAAGKET